MEDSTPPAIWNVKTYNMGSSNVSMYPFKKDNKCQVFACSDRSGVLHLQRD